MQSDQNFAHHNSINQTVFEWFLGVKSQNVSISATLIPGPISLSKGLVLLILMILIVGKNRKKRNYV